MASAKFKIGVGPLNFSGIANLAANVITGLTTHPSNFPTPDPPITNLTADLLSLNNAIATWGPVHNRGSHADYVDLVQKAQHMRDQLIKEGAYVEGQLVVGDPYSVQAAFIVTSGFGVKNLPSPQGVLAAPQNLHRRMSDAISEDDIFLDWEKPLGLTSPNNVKSYKVQVDGTVVALSTKTSFLLGSAMVLVHGTNYDVIVIPVNTNGDGTPSAMLTINF